ncbi:MAG: apolipoprotein N-acyltransferase [Roseovarius sp.]
MRATGDDWGRAVMAWRPRWQAALAAMLGALGGLGQAPFDLWPLTLLTMAALFGLMRAATSWRHAFWLGLAAGWGYFALALFWIVEPFFVDAARHGWMAPFALFFLALGMGLFWGAATALARAAGSGAGAFIGAFTLAEALRGHLFTGFPWAQLGHALIDTPVLGWASLGGTLMLTALMAAGGAGLWLLAARRLLPGLLLVAPLVGLFAAAPLLPEAPRPGADAPIIRLIQPNAPQHQKWHPDYVQIFYDRQIAFTSEPPEGVAPALTVWPETAVPMVLSNAGPTLKAISRAARGRPVILGIQRFEGLRYYNSLIRLDQQGEVSALYDKHHLVPFGEYMPFGDFFARFGIDGLAANEGFGYSAGPGPVTIDMGALGRALPLICYEGVFPRNTRGAGGRPDMLLMITNDAWFGQISGPYQHLAQARLRSAERGLPMVRVANTGVSAMIDARGEITESIPLGEAGWRDAALPPPLPPTPYARLGDAPMLALAVLLLGASLLYNRRQTRDI